MKPTNTAIAVAALCGGFGGLHGIRGGTRDRDLRSPEEQADRMAAAEAKRARRRRRQEVAP